MSSLFRVLGVAGSVLFASGAVAADLPVKALAPVTAGPTAVFFGGASVSPHSWYTDFGLTWGLNHNLNTDGFLLRLTAGTGNYNYLMTPALKNSVDFHTADLMVGYQLSSNNIRFTGYIGTQVHHHDNDFDALATIKGTKWGIIGQGEVFANIGDRSYALLVAQASSVWSGYYLLGRYGYRVAPTIAIGPELTALGNEKFDAQRAGLFAALDLTPNFHFVVSGGYHWQDESFRSGDGGYALVHLRATY